MTEQLLKTALMFKPQSINQSLITHKMNMEFSLLTLSTFSKSAAEHKYSNLLFMKVELLNRGQNMAAKGDITHYEHFFHFPPSFSKLVRCNGVLCCLYQGEG